MALEAEPKGGMLKCHTSNDTSRFVEEGNVQ